MKIKTTFFILISILLESIVSDAEENNKSVIYDIKKKESIKDVELNFGVYQNRSTNSEVWIKTANEQSLKDELRILSNFLYNSKHIVQLKDSYRKNGKLNLLLEYEPVFLDSLPKDHSPEQILYLANEFFDAFAEIHKQGVVLNDLSLSNAVVDIEGRIKLITCKTGQFVEFAGEDQILENYKKLGTLLNELYHSYKENKRLTNTEENYKYEACLLNLIHDLASIFKLAAENNTDSDLLEMFERVSYDLNLETEKIKEKFKNLNQTFADPNREALKSIENKHVKKINESTFGGDIRKIKIEAVKKKNSTQVFIPFSPILALGFNSLNYISESTFNLLSNSNSINDSVEQIKILKKIMNKYQLSKKEEPEKNTRTSFTILK